MEPNSFISDFTALMEIFLMAITVYLSVVTAYLVAAYTVGSKLTQRQNIFISILFVSFAFIFAFTAWGFGNAAAAIYENNSEGGGAIQSYLPWILAFCEAAGIAGSLNFMLGIRRNTHGPGDT